MLIESQNKVYGCAELASKGIHLAKKKIQQKLFIKSEKCTQKRSAYVKEIIFLYFPPSTFTPIGGRTL